MSYAMQLHQEHKERVARMNAASWDVKRQKAVEDRLREEIAELRAERDKWKEKYEQAIIPCQDSTEEIKCSESNGEGVDQETISLGLSAAQIKKVVCAKYDIDKERLETRRQLRKIVLPRQVAMHLCCKLLKLSLPDIGRRFGGFHHTTVMSANRRIEDMRAADLQFDSEMRQLEEQLDCT